MSKKFILVALILCLGNSLVAEGRRWKVMTSIFPLLDFARQIAGDKAEVSLLLPPGADVHTWQPRPGEILALSRADLFIYCGANLEPWAAGLVKNYRNSGGRVLEAGAGLAVPQPDFEPGRESSAGAADPHVWLDLGLDEAIVLRVAHTLAELDPESRVFFQRRAEAYIDRLRALDGEFRLRLQGCRHRTVVLAGHAAFGYLAARYGLVQASLSGLSPDSEPGPRRIIRIIELMKQEKASTVFFIKNESPKLAGVLARETKARLLPLHPAHNLTREELRSGLTFLEIMKDNLVNLAEGLNCAKR